MYPKATKFCELPDDLLVRILSFVPTKDVVATSILSKRWGPVWKLALIRERNCVELCSICSLDCFPFILMQIPNVRDLRLKQQGCCCNLLREQWKQPRFVPLSLMWSLKIVEWIGYKGRKETERKAVDYILRNARNLKTVDITSSTSNTDYDNINILIDLNLHQQRSSDDCDVFVN